jgi:hypothetical protein
MGRRKLLQSAIGLTISQFNITSFTVPSLLSLAAMICAVMAGSLS